MTIFLFIAMSLLLVPVNSLRYVAYLGIFFSGFTATVVFNFSNSQGISVFLFFALVLCLFVGTKRFLLLSQRSAFFVQPSQLVMLQFAFFAFVSSLMPMVIDGSVSVPSNLAFEEEYDISVVFSLTNFLKCMPLLVGIFFSICIVSLLRYEKHLYSAIKVLLSSILFVSLWGFMQLCGILFGFEYPDFIFNNIASETGRGFSQILGAYSGFEVPRIASVTHEPLVFSKFLIIALPLLIFSINLRQYYFSQRLDIFSLGFISVMVLASTSTTGVVGLLGSFLLSQLLLRRHFSGRIPYFMPLIFLGSIIIFCGVLYTVNSTVASYINLLFIDKLSSGSGLERVASVVNSFEYIWVNPTFGLGWNMVTVNDLVINLLVNSGFFGLASFLFMVGYLLFKAMESLNQYRIGSASRIQAIKYGLFGSLVLQVILGLYTGIEFYLGYFYMVLGLLAASIAVSKRQKVI